MVTQLINTNGNAVKNQFIIEENNTKIFQSYNTKICKIEGGNIILDPKWYCSATTLKYLKTFLRISLSKKAIETKISKGEYIIESLN
jgi:hypothetical protein